MRNYAVVCVCRSFLLLSGGAYGKVRAPYTCALLYSVPYTAQAAAAAAVAAATLEAVRAGGMQASRAMLQSASSHYGMLLIDLIGFGRTGAVLVCRRFL